MQTYFVATVHIQLYFYSQKTNTGERRVAEVLRPRSYFTVSSYNFLKELNNTENVPYTYIDTVPYWGVQFVAPLGTA